MKRLALLLALPVLANAQAELPAAQPYTGPAVIPGAVATPTTPTYQSTFTYTGGTDNPNPREEALKETFKIALQGLLSGTFQPPIPAAEVKRLTEESDPARFVQSYRIESESFAPDYSLTTHITWSERALLNALGLNTPAVNQAIIAHPVTPTNDPLPAAEDVSTSDGFTPITYPANGPIQIILANPLAGDMAKLKAAAIQAGHPLKLVSLSKLGAIFEGDAELATTLATNGYVLEEDPTAFTPTYRIQ